MCSRQPVRSRLLRTAVARRTALAVRQAGRRGSTFLINTRAIAGRMRAFRAERGTPRDLGDACAVAEAGVRADVSRHSALRQPVLIGVAHGLGAISGAGLVEDPVDVGLDGCTAKDELVGDFAVRQTESD